MRGYGIGRRRRSSRSRGKSQGYTIRDRRRRIKYVGETNNPQRRAAEHEQDGKTGTLKVETGPMSRAAARRWEKRKLANHRKTHRGKNPVYNKTRDGGMTR